MEDTLRRFASRRLGKADKGLRRCSLAKSTGLSPPQVERLIRQYRDTGKVRDRHIANSIARIEAGSTDRRDRHARRPSQVCGAMEPCGTDEDGARGTDSGPW